MTYYIWFTKDKNAASVQNTCWSSWHHSYSAAAALNLTAWFQDSYVHHVLHNQSYNQVVEDIIRSKDSTDEACVAAGVCKFVSKTFCSF